jgi:hypothetical protein
MHLTLKLGEGCTHFRARTVPYHAHMMHPALTIAMTCATCRYRSMQPKPPQAENEGVDSTPNDIATYWPPKNGPVAQAAKMVAMFANRTAAAHVSA